jgi:hypothetical protein
MLQICCYREKVLLLRFCAAILSMLMLSLASSSIAARKQSGFYAASKLLQQVNA